MTYFHVMEVLMLKRERERDSFNAWRQSMPSVAGQRFEIALPGPAEPADGPGTERCFDCLEFSDALSLSKVHCETLWLYGRLAFDLHCLWWFIVVPHKSQR